MSKYQEGMKLVSRCSADKEKKITLWGPSMKDVRTKSRKVNLPLVRAGTP